MTLSEFREQDKYCRENNTPEGVGCPGCPAGDKKHCADFLRGLCGQWLDAARNHQKDKLDEISKRLDREFGMTPYYQLGVAEGFIELPDKKV